MLVLLVIWLLVTGASALFLVVFLTVDECQVRTREPAADTAEAGQPVSSPAAHQAKTGVSDAQAA